MFLIVVFFFFFKQKTAYEMRISDWSSDVCSSDLAVWAVLIQVSEARGLPPAKGVIGEWHRDRHVHADHADVDAIAEVAGSVAVAGEDGGAVAVGIRHRKLPRLAVILGAHHREHRSEDLFLVDIHVGGHKVEQAATDEEAVLIALHG